MAEAVTLAHVGRLMALADTLDPAAYDIYLACAGRYRDLISAAGLHHIGLFSIDSAAFLAALAQGAPPYSAATLRRYVEDDLRVLEQVTPDLVVGDFRLSLSVSARVAKVPYIAVANAYWSPYATPRYTVPELGITKIMGVSLSQMLFRLVRPLAFAHHARALNTVRREHGMPSLGPDLRRLYTDGDITLYADMPGIVPTAELPPSHRFIGPVPWSPAVAAPPWWDELPADRPIVYVTMGSSGSAGTLATVVQGMARLPVSVIVSSAGGEVPAGNNGNTYCARYLPGAAAAARSSLVICNGGSPTCYQALAAGAPVIGVAANLDQYLNMEYIQRTGAGVLMRSGRVSPAGIAACARRVLADSQMSAAARRQATLLRNIDYQAAFNEVIGCMQGPGRPADS